MMSFSSWEQDLENIPERVDEKQDKKKAMERQKIELYVKLCKV
ncbi:hypothetical protein ES703_124386 [subsurface metagenome]|jgi:hypothetical protein